MRRFADIFYIFTKLTTSLILLILLILLLYALYLSYAGVDKASEKFENKFLMITKEINENSSKLINLEKINQNNENLLKNINKNINNSQDKQKILKIEKKIDLLMGQIEKINEQFVKVNFNKEKKYKEKYENLPSSVFQEIKSIKGLIIEKYKSGKLVNIEIEILKNYSTNTPDEIFEKLYIIESKNFIGIESLLVEFDSSTEQYIKNIFIENNHNSVIKFLLKYIDIKPNNLNNYESEHLNTLVRAKKHLQNDEYIESLNQVLLLENNDKYFKYWKDQINIFLNFNQFLAKVS